MLTQPDIDLLVRGVLLGTFALSAVFGAIMHRTGFCTMGAISDVITMGETTRLRQWALAAGVATVGFGALAAGGWVQAADTVYAGPRWMWLSSIVGGLLFGVGMVLASGCGARMLVRLGGGNLKGLIVFLVMGLASYVTARWIRSTWCSTVRPPWGTWPPARAAGRCLPACWWRRWGWGGC